MNKFFIPLKSIIIIIHYIKIGAGKRPLGTWPSIVQKKLSEANISGHADDYPTSN
jgi:hypothetical protein